MVQTWFYQGWTGYRNEAALFQNWFYQGRTGYKNEAARRGTVGPRRRVTHLARCTEDPLTPSKGGVSLV